jgi:hypothetical protein
MDTGRRTAHGLLKFELEVVVQSDGSLMARSAAPPILLVAPDSAELARMLGGVNDAIGRFLEDLGPEGAAAYLRDVGATTEPSAERWTISLAIPA